MGKNLFISIYLLLGTSCIHSDFQGNIAVNQPVVERISPVRKEVVVKPVIEPYKKIVPIAKSFVGITEVGGNNQGFSDLSYQKRLEKLGWKKGQSWCGYAVMLTLDSAGIKHRVTAWSPSSFNRKNVVYTDGEFQKEFRQGDVFSLSYQKFKNDKTRFKGIGHTGIVEKIVDNGRNVQTYEGNAQIRGDGNDGGGYHRKIRPINKSLHITRWE
jgi:hypothetical protein